MRFAKVYKSSLLMTYVSKIIRVLISQDREAEWNKLRSVEHKSMYPDDPDYVVFERLAQKDFSEESVKQLLARCTARAYSNVKGQTTQQTDELDAETKAAVKRLATRLHAEKSALVMYTFPLATKLMSAVLNQIMSYGFTPKEIASGFGDEVDQMSLSVLVSDPKNEIMELVERMGANASALLSCLYDEQTLSELENQDFAAVVRLGLSGDVGPDTTDLCHFLACLLGSDA